MLFQFAFVFCQDSSHPFRIGFVVIVIYFCSVNWPHTTLWWFMCALLENNLFWSRRSLGHTETNPYGWNNVFQFNLSHKFWFVLTSSSIGARNSISWTSLGYSFSKLQREVFTLHAQSVVEGELLHQRNNTLITRTGLYHGISNTTTFRCSLKVTIQKNDDLWLLNMWYLSQRAASPISQISSIAWETIIVYNG